MLSFVPRPGRRRTTAATRTTMPAPPAVAVVVAASALLLLAGCSTTPAAPTTGGPLRVVAAENIWGDLAAPLGGEYVTVHSIIDNPAADPHDYEPVAADARAIASAQVLLDNGLGYDPWAAKLASANPVPDRVELTVGRIVGVAAGGNPHQWYSPTSVRAVINAITATYQRLAPAHASYFADQRDRLLNTDLAPYFTLITAIRTQYGGQPIGASESIVSPLARALGLTVLTPQAFLLAVSEGTEPTAQDKATIDRQIAAHQIKVYVYNNQNATPDVRAQVTAATAAGIPVVTLTETPTPAGTSFQAWQVRQLTELQHALERSTGGGTA